MADQRSVEMLAFILARKTFADKRIAQGLSRSLSAFSSLMCQYLDPVVKTDQGAQYADDIGVTANNARHATRNIRAVFKCIRPAGVKLTTNKSNEGRTTSAEGNSPQARKVHNFLDKLTFPKSKKALQR